MTIIAMTVLSGCSFLQPVDRVIVKTNKDSGFFKPSIKQRVYVDDFNRFAAEKGGDLLGVAQYALIANATYELRTPLRKSTIRPQPTLIDKSKAGLPRTLNGLCNFDSQYLAAWKNDIDLSSEETSDKLIKFPRYRLRTKGFKYQVWHDTGPSGTKRVVIAFRGTTGTFGDWYSNFRIGTRFFYLGADHYDQTVKLMDELIPLIKAKYGDGVQIITTGHSLGGGLAQNAAYASEDINLSYVFANSPVTGVSAIDRGIVPTFRFFSKEAERRKKAKKASENLVIYKISERGEILSGMRRVFGVFGRFGNLTNARVNEVKFNFRRPFEGGKEVDGSSASLNPLVAQHSIAQLACDTICRVENGKDHATCTANAFKPLRDQ